MPKFRVRVDSKSGLAYIPKEVREQGFTGECEGLPDAFTFTLVKPGSSLAQVKRGLQLTLKQLDLMMEHDKMIGDAAGEEKAKAASLTPAAAEIE